MLGSWRRLHVQRTCGLTRLAESIASEYEISVGPRLGPGPNDAKQARALNRVTTWYDDRIEYEADPRQAERLISECGLTGANPMGTPGAKVTYQDHEAGKDDER